MGRFKEIAIGLTNIFCFHIASRKGRTNALWLTRNGKQMLEHESNGIELMDKR